MIRTALLAVIFFLTADVFAVTSRGILRQNETWKGDIELSGDIIVPENIVLTIRPGTKIGFIKENSMYDATFLEKIGDKNIDVAYDDLVSIVVKGKLVCEGTEQDNIYFGMQKEGDSGNPWGSLIFFNDIQASSVKNTRFANAKTGILTKGNAGLGISGCSFSGNDTGLIIIGASPVVTDSILSKNNHSGIIVAGSSSPRISGNRIYDNRIKGGILCYDDSRPVIERNIFSRNSTAIEVNDLSDPSFNGNQYNDNRRDVTGIFKNTPGGEFVSSSGRISGQAVWSGNVRITGDIIIPEGSRLTVRPGTEVELSPNMSDYDFSIFRMLSGEEKDITHRERCDIIVKGTLIVEGEENSKVFFSSPGKKERILWGGLIFIGSAGESEIKHATITNANVALFCWDRASPRIENCYLNDNMVGIACVDSASPLIENNVISKNNFGIGAYDISSPRIRDNVIADGSVIGIGSKDKSVPKLINNRIIGNDIGVSVHDTSSPLISSNVISDNRYGIFSEGLSSPNIKKNLISKNTEAGIGIKGFSTPQIEDNRINENKDGILYWVTASPVIGYNVFSDNDEKIVASSEGIMPTTTGRMAHNEIWEGSIYLTGDVFIPTGVTLTVNPGTIITFTPNKSDYDMDISRKMDDKWVNVAYNNRIDIIVEGTVVMMGGDKNVIMIGNPELQEAAEKSVSWGGIIFLGRGVESRLENCTIKHANMAVSTWDSISPKILSSVFSNNEFGISCNGESMPRLNENRCMDNRFGIVIADTSRPLIEKCIITKNKYGILSGDNSGGRISDNLISRNNLGAEVSDYSSVSISSNTFASNKLGVSCKHFSSPAIENNKFRENTDAIRIEDKSAPKAANNTYFKNEKDILDMRYPGVQIGEKGSESKLY